MTEFNANDYFNEAATQTRNQETQGLFEALRNGEDLKKRSVADATQRKLDALRNSRDAREATWTGKLGLDPQSLTGGVVNFGASVAGATVEAGGALVGAPSNMGAISREMETPDEIRQAYARHQSGVASEEDMALLNQRNARDNELNEAAGYVPTETEEANHLTQPTFLERLDTAGELREGAESVREFADIRSIIDETARDRFSDDIRSGGAEGIDQLKEAAQNYEDGEIGSAATNLALGLTDLVINGGSTVLSNKQATLEYVAELAPDLIIGAISKPGLVLRNVGMGMEAHNRGIEKYAQENDGALPPEELQRYMAANAFGVAMLETLAQFSILRSIRGPQVNTGTNTSFSPARVAKATGRETLVEGATEGGQAYLEGEASLTPASAMDIYEGATIGAAAGGTVTGAGRTVTEARAGSVEQRQARANRDANEAAEVETFQSAVNTGDTSVYTDRENTETYDPAKAAAVLVARNQQDIPAQARTQDQEKMEGLLRQADEDLKNARDVAEGYTPEAIARYGRQIKKQESDLAAATTDQARAEAEANIEMLNERLARAEEMPAERLKTVNKRVDQLQQTFTRVQELRNELAAPTETPSTVDGEPEIDTSTLDVGTLKTEAGVTGTTQQDGPVRAQAANNLVTMSMASPDVLNSAEAQTLASDEGNGLSANQRTYLRSFADSLDQQEGVRSLNRTKLSIFKGEDGFRGIQDYRSLVNSALTTNDTEGAQEYAADLTRFAEGHTQKANALTEALKQYSQTGKPVQVVRGLNQGEWFISQEKLSKNEMTENKGLTVGARAKPLVNAVREEAKALWKADKEMKALLNVHTDGSQPESTAATETSSQQQPEAVSNTESTVDELNTTQVTEADTVAEQDRQADEAAVEQTQKEADADATTDTETTEPTTQIPATEATTTEATDTAVTEPTIEPETEPTTTTEPEVTLEDGRLDAVTGEHTKGTATNNAFRTTNLISTYFNQSAGREGSTTLRPLAEVKDFLTQLSQDSTLVQRFISADNKDLPEREVARATALNTFQETVTDWNSTLDELFAGKDNEAFNYTNLVQFVKTEDGRLPENVKTAISYAAWTHVVEKTNDSWHNDDDAINAILRQPSDTKVSQAHRALLIDKGTRANVVINSLGERAVKALGLKLHPDAPVNAQAQLESALGAYAVAVLMDQGLVERPVVKDSLMNETDPSNVRADGEGHPFIRMARNWDAEGKPVTPEARAISDSVKQTQGYLDKVFGVEPAKQGPTFEAEGFNQTKTRGTQQNVPSEMTRIQDQQAKKAWKVRTWFNGLWQDIDTDLQDQILGLEDPTTAHITERMGVEGRNDDLARGKEHLDSFLADLELNDVDGLNPYDQSFYFNGSVWVNQRVGLTSNTVNPQANKLHRHIMGMADWAGEISLNPSNREHQLFLANVAMGLGVKADKMPMAKSRKELQAKVKDPVIREGLEAVKKQQRGDSLERGDQEHIVNAVKQAGEGMQSLDALHAYARMQVAQRDPKQKTFDADMMMMEVDGVTNGPMLTLLLLGAATGSKSLYQNLNKGGFYEVGSDHRNFVSYKDRDGAEDLYETLAKGMNTEMQGLVKGKPELVPVVDAIEYAKGQFFDAKKGKVTSAGRGTVKTPLTGMMFGQAVKSGVNDMFTEFTEELYGKVTKIARDNGTDQQKQADLREWAGHINAMMRGKESIPAQPTLEWALEHEFSKAEQRAMQEGFNETIGAAVESTMETQFGVFLDRRKVLNQGAQVSSQLYTMMFEHLKQQKVNELMEAGSLPFRTATGKKNKGQKQPLQDLSARQIREIENQLSAMKPVAHSALSSAESDLKSALFLPKTGKTLSNNANYGQDVGLARTVSANTADGNDIKTFGTKGYESVLEDPGVRSLILMVHSADSAISAYAYDQLSALNVHDANGLSIADVAAGARNLNEATYRVMYEFSVPMELKATMERTVNGLHEMLPMIEGSPELQATYAALETEFTKRLTKEEAAEFEKSGQDWVTFTQQKVNNVAYAAEITKQEALSEMAFVDQYAQEGGEFEVTDALRQEAKAKAEKVRLEASAPQNLRQAQQIAKAAKQIAGDAAAVTQDTDSGVQSVESYFSPEEIAAGLKQWVGTKTNEMRQAIQQTGTRDSRQMQQIQNLKKLAQTYATTGSMDTALERVFPGNDQSRLREAWKSAVIKKLNQEPFTTASVLHAPNHAVLPLVDQLLSSDETSTELVTSLERVRDTMLNQQASLSLAGDTTLTPQQNAEVVQALGAVYNSSRVTAYGELGTPTTPSDTNMVAFMQNNPNLTAGELMGYLDRRFKENGNRNGSVDMFQRRLLGMLKQTVKADVPVRYVTRDTPDTDLPQGSVNGAKGWYEPSLDNQHIGIKSPDFVHSAVTPEVVLHELTHQALGRVVADEQAKAPKDRDEATWELIQDLESLRELAEVKIEALANAPDATAADKARNRQFKNAVENVHEFMAWGMTNQEFQTQVLAKLEYQTTVQGGNRLLTGMQKFIKNLTGLIFGKRADTRQERGMSVLIANVSGLFAASKEQGNQGSTTNQTTQRQETPDPFDTVKQYTTEQLYDALGRRQTDTLDPEYSDHLKTVLNTIVRKLHGPAGAYKVKAEENATFGSEDVFLTSLMGRMPFASEVVGQPFKVTEQEAFVLEQVEATVQASADSSTAAYRELAKLYRETKARLRPEDFFDGDWSQATPTERSQAEAQYNFIFQPQTNADGTSNYLSRFAAMGLAYEPLRKNMDAATSVANDSFQGKPLGEKLKTIFTKLVNLLNGRLTQTYQGQQANQKLDTLMDQLVSIESRRRTALARKEHQGEGAIEGSLNKLNDSMRKRADDFGKSKFFRDSKSGVVQAVGVATSAVAGDRVRNVFDNIEKVRNRNFKERQGFLSALGTELKGANETNLTAHKLLRMANKNQRERKNVIDQTAKMVRESYADKGAYLTEADTQAITRVVLRTDMAALMDSYTADDLLNLVRDPKALDQAIQNTEVQVKGKHRHYYVRGAKDLGYFMATNINRNDNLMMNARNLSRLVGTGRENSITTAQAQAVEGSLDQLASLYALQYSPSKDRTLMAEVMKTELQRGNESGVDMTLRMHKRMKQESMEKLFKDAPNQFMKGYTKEIYNPYKNVVIASGVEGKNLERAGARVGPVLEADTAEGNQPVQRLYTIEDGGLHSMVTGIFSNTGTKKRGSAVHNGNPSRTNQTTNQQIARNKAKAIDRMFSADPTYDPQKKAPQKMVPVVGNNGQVMNYRYMMTADTKDTLLERNNRVEDVMGSMAGNLVDKVSTDLFNNKAVDALRDQYRQEGPTNPDAFIEVSMKSDDPEIREAYRLLPDNTKKHINKVWGRDAMMVRVDLYDIHFGYRKRTITQSFKKDADERNAIENVVIGVLESNFLLGKKAALRVRQAEDGWQAIVKEIKDLLVIKRLPTLMLNISSNTTVLMWMGVSPKDIVKNHRKGLDGALNYQRDHNELMHLERMKEIGYITQPVAEMEARIVELKDAIARNPVKEMIDNGMFQTIIDDVDNSEDDYGYKSKLMRKVDDKTQWVPQAVKDAGKFAYMAHDTPLYKLMHQGASLSDFIGRYTLYEHMVNRKKKPMDKEAAMQLAVDAFVNYDIPTHRFMQYLNDMGMIYFTKYYLRIQKVLMNLYKDSPGRALAIGVGASYLDNTATLMDSGFWNRLDNPTSNGAFGYPGVIGEALPIKAGMSLFQ